MKEVTSVLEFANAAAIERINYELVKVIENIQNPNTDEKPRKLTVELCLTPVNNSPDNLRALCQRCHNRYDAKHRAETRRSKHD